MLGLALFWTGRSMHDFLSVCSPVPANVLIVEGWLPDNALAQAIAEFESGQYQLLITTSGPIERGALLAEYATHAELAAATLLALHSIRSAWSRYPPRLKQDIGPTRARWPSASGLNKTDCDRMA
jgi:hypothetical protein